MRNLGDLGHRVVFTFVETFTGFLLAEPLIEAIGGNLNLPVWQTAVGASLAAAVVPVKEYARRQINRSESLNRSDDA